MTLTFNAFDLPDRLSAKRDPGLIATDEQHFADLSRHLEKTVVSLSARLAEQLAAPGGHGQAALDRDLDVHRISTQLGALRRYGIDLCLGRMVVASTAEPVYIGRIGLTDETGAHLLTDWRSPAAEPFFGATFADPMGLVSRRRYRWGNGRVTDYWDEAFDEEALRDDAALDDHSAFIASLGASRSDRMRNVLSTMQADQDAIVRAGSRGALVVDGGPGTGKTVVALHRAAYLLYAEPHLGHHGGVLVVGPSRGYLAFVSDVLPSLGEEGVLTCTIADLVPESAEAGEETDPRVAELKSSAAAVTAVERAVRYHERPPETTLVVEMEWADVPLTPEDWAAAFDAAEPGAPHNEGREQVWEELISILTTRLRGVVPAATLRAELERDEALRRAFDRAWPLLDPVGVVADLLSVPGYLQACAPELAPAEITAMQRNDSRAWTTADLPLLDAARAAIGDPQAARRRRVHDATVAIERERMSIVVDDLIAADDDGEGLVTILRGEDARTSLEDEAALPAHQPDALAGPFAHIVVDEAQELTDAEWRMLLRRCPSRSLTVVGDRAQARHGFTESWSDRLSRVGLCWIEQMSLTINYRTPAEIMAHAAPAIRAAIPDANVPVSIRSTGIPVRHGRATELGAVLDAWLAKNADGIAGVIGDVRTPPRPRVQVLDPASCKGLEFDLVVLVDPQRFGDGVQGAVDRYVAMSRSTRQLIVLTSDVED